MSSPQKLVVPGFGIGSVYGVPLTIALGATSTLSITSALVGEYTITGVEPGVRLVQVSNSNGVTDTIAALNGAPGRAFLDGVSNFLVNTTTAVTIKIYGP